MSSGARTIASETCHSMIRLCLIMNIIIKCPNNMLQMKPHFINPSMSNQGEVNPVRPEDIAATALFVGYCSSPVFGSAGSSTTITLAIELAALKLVLEVLKGGQFPLIENLQPAIKNEVLMNATTLYWGYTGATG